MEEPQTKYKYNFDVSCISSNVFIKPLQSNVTINCKKSLFLKCASIQGKHSFVFDGA